MRARSGPLTAVVALSMATALLLIAAPSQAAGNTLTVNVGTVVRPVTHVAAGGLYYYPSSASEIGAELLYSDPQDGDSEFGAHLRFETHFN